MTEEKAQLTKELEGLEKKYNATECARNQLEQKTESLEQHQQQQNAEAATWKETCDNTRRETEVEYSNTLCV